MKKRIPFIVPVLTAYVWFFLFLISPPFLDALKNHGYKKAASIIKFVLTSPLLLIMGLCLISIFMELLDKLKKGGEPYG